MTLKDLIDLLEDLKYRVDGVDDDTSVIIRTTGRVSDVKVEVTASMNNGYVRAVDYETQVIILGAPS